MTDRLLKGCFTGLILSLFTAGIAEAAPNIWSSEFQQQWWEYTIHSPKNKIKIAIGCMGEVNENADDEDEGEAEEIHRNLYVYADGEDLIEKEHANKVEYYKNEEENTRDGYDQVEFYIDGKLYTFDTEMNDNLIEIPTEYKSTGLAWTEFLEKLQKATKIEVFFAEEKIGELNPREDSLKNLKDITTTCASVY